MLRRMTQQTKKAVRHHAWKWVGSLFMEKKDNHWAMSLHRVLTLMVAIQAMWIWSGVTEQKDLPEGMLWVLLGLLGVNGVGKGLGAFKK